LTADDRLIDDASDDQSRHCISCIAKNGRDARMPIDYVRDQQSWLVVHCIDLRMAAESELGVCLVRSNDLVSFNAAAL
jgi:hypothetical protein